MLIDAQDILYVILIAKDKVVTLIRPRKHSIHPAGNCNYQSVLFDLSNTILDLHIILNTLHSPSILNSPASASWIPFCLPKFNPSGFVNVFIAFPRKDDTGAQGAHNTPPHDQTFSTEHLENAAESLGGPNELNESDVALVCITGGGDFEAIRGWCETVITVRSIRNSPVALFLPTFRGSKKKVLCMRWLALSSPERQSTPSLS